MRSVLPNPEIENLAHRLDCLDAFLTAPDVPDDD